MAAVDKYASHPSIIAIKSRANSVIKFDIKAVTEDDILKEILALDDSKKVSGSIPTKMLKVAAKECVPVLTKCFNDGVIDNSKFPCNLSLADVIPAFKKGNAMDKCNYRPISLLPTISKVYERIIAKQITPFLDSFLSKFLCGFRKGYNCQYALIHMLRNWQKCLSNSGKVGAILMDLSKAFDSLPHDLMIAKLSAYGFGYKSLKLFSSYLSDRKQRVR